MKINGTYAQLNSMLGEFNAFKNQYPTIYTLILYSKVRHFRLQNKKPLTELNQKLTDLLAQCCEQNDNGEPKLSEQITEDGAVQMPVFINDEARAFYEKEWNEFLKQPCTIHI